MASPAGPSLFGLPMKQFSLITLTFQNSILILVMHAARIQKPTGDHRFFTSTAVLLDEVIKLAVSLTFAIYEVSSTLAPQTPATVLFEQIYRAVFSGDGFYLALPAALYTLVNTCQYVALGNLDPVQFQILYQLKILTTAFFSTVLLGRSLGIKRWLSLLLLTFGVSIVSLPSSAKDSASVPLIHDTSDHFFPRSMHELGHIANGVADVARELTKRTLDDLSTGLAKRSASYQGIQEDQDGAGAMNPSIGLAAVVVAAVASGLAGVWFEKVLKESATPVSVWIRNIQLSFYSLFPALIFGVILKDGEEIAKHGFFDGYNWVVWTSIALQAVGGLLSSLSINYADNILKNFATSISVAIGFFFSVWFFDFQVSFTFALGTSIVLFATYLYSGPERKRGRPPPINIVSYEKTAIDPNTPHLGVVSAPEQGKLTAGLEPLDSLKVGLSTSRPASPLRYHTRTLSSRSRNFDD